MSPLRRRSAAAIGIAALALAASGSPAQADDPDDYYEAPAGEACTFPLTIVGYGTQPVSREFEGRDGSVRFLGAGPGAAYTFTNVDTGATYTPRPPRGAYAVWVRANPDGSQVVTYTGHAWLVLFPTDTPKGPSTTLYTGRFVLHADADENYTLLSATGRAIDICAALS